MTRTKSSKPCARTVAARPLVTPDITDLEIFTRYQFFEANVYGNNQKCSEQFLMDNVYTANFFSECNQARARVVFIDPETEFKKIYPDYDMPSLGPGEAIIVPGKKNSVWDSVQHVNLKIALSDEFMLQLMYQKLLQFRDLPIFGEMKVDSLATEIRKNCKDTRIYSYKQHLKVTHVGDMIPTFGNKNTFFILINKNYFFEKYINQIKLEGIFDAFNFFYGEIRHTVNLLEEIKKAESKNMTNAMILNFKNRMDIYLNDSYKAVRSSILPRANKILELLDITDMVYTSTPIVNQLKSLRYVVPFMKITINTLISFLLLLNFVLIYHIFGLSLQDKLFHFGIMRTLGFKRNRLYLVLFAQGLFLSTITFVIALPLMYVLFGLFNSMNLQVQLFEDSTYPSFSIILFTCAVNFVVPQVSLLLPGYRFFSKKIMESIDNRAELFSSLKLSQNDKTNIFSRN